MTLKDRGKNCHLLRVINRSYKPLAVCTINYARSANVARSANDARRAIMTAEGLMSHEVQRREKNHGHYQTIQRLPLPQG